MRRLTKQQYELLENFGLRRIGVRGEPIDAEKLREAVHAAVFFIPFKDVEGMDADPDEAFIRDARMKVEGLPTITMDITILLTEAQAGALCEMAGYSKP